MNYAEATTDLSRKFENSPISSNFLECCSKYINAFLKGKLNKQKTEIDIYIKKNNYNICIIIFIDIL